MIKNRKWVEFLSVILFFIFLTFLEFNSAKADGWLTDRDQLRNVIASKQEEFKGRDRATAAIVQDRILTNLQVLVSQISTEDQWNLISPAIQRALGQNLEWPEGAEEWFTAEWFSRPLIEQKSDLGIQQQAIVGSTNGGVKKKHIQELTPWLQKNFRHKNKGALTVSLASIDEYLSRLNQIIWKSHPATSKKRKTTSAIEKLPDPLPEVKSESVSDPSLSEFPAPSSSAIPAGPSAPEAPRFITQSSFDHESPQKDAPPELAVAAVPSFSNLLLLAEEADRNPGGKTLDLKRPRQEEGVTSPGSLIEKKREKTEPEGPVSKPLIPLSQLELLDQKALSPSEVLHLLRPLCAGNLNVCFHAKQIHSTLLSVYFRRGLADLFAFLEEPEFSLDFIFEKWQEKGTLGEFLTLAILQNKTDGVPGAQSFLLKASSRVTPDTFQKMIHRFVQYLFIYEHYRLSDYQALTASFQGQSAIQNLLLEEVRTIFSTFPGSEPEIKEDLTDWMSKAISFLGTSTPDSGSIVLERLTQDLLTRAIELDGIPGPTVRKLFVEFEKRTDLIGFFQKDLQARFRQLYLSHQISDAEKWIKSGLFGAAN